MSFWIFVFTEYTDYARGSSRELFARVERNGKWYIGPNTPNRKRVKKGDKIIFYRAGEGGRKFIGNAILSSGLKPPEKSDFFSFVLVSKMCLWSKPVPISDIAEDLSFVKRGFPSRFYFQSGIRSISEEDYRTILRYAKNVRS